MKHLIISCFFFLLCYHLAKAQTNADTPGPENVLVVFNENSEVSDSIKEYYKTARGIPAGNIVPLYLPDTIITIGGVTHPIIIAEGGNIIRDSINHTNGTWYASRQPGNIFINMSHYR